MADPGLRDPGLLCSGLPDSGLPHPGYVAAAIGVAIVITVTLRALPFLLKAAVADSDLLADLGRWMPLGAVAILALYCLSAIDFSGATHGLPELAGVAVTVAAHLWKRNAVLSIVAGTAACLALTAAI